MDGHQDTRILVWVPFERSRLDLTAWTKRFINHCILRSLLISQTHNLWSKWWQNSFAYFSKTDLRIFFASSWCVITTTFCHWKWCQNLAYFDYSEIIPFIMNLLNSRYAYSNLNIEFWYTSLWHCTIHFKRNDEN